MTEPTAPTDLLEPLTLDEISEALLHFVLRRNGFDPTQVRWQKGQVSYPKNQPPPSTCAVCIVQVTTLPPPATAAPPVDSSRKG